MRDLAPPGLAPAGHTSSRNRPTGPHSLRGSGWGHGPAPLTRSAWLPQHTVQAADGCPHRHCLAYWWAAPPQGMVMYLFHEAQQFMSLVLRHRTNHHTSPPLCPHAPPENRMRRASGCPGRAECADMDCLRPEL